MKDIHLLKKLKIKKYRCLLNDQLDVIIITYRSSGNDT